MRKILKREGYGEDEVTDLFFVNYKPVDSIGHTYNMVDPEVGRLFATRTCLLRSWRGSWTNGWAVEEWVVALTADHGQTPHPSTTGAWAIDQDVLMEQTAEHFDVPESRRCSRRRRPTMYWLKPGLKKRLRRYPSRDRGLLLATHDRGQRGERQGAA